MMIVIVEFQDGESNPYRWDYDEPIVVVLNKYKAIELKSLNYDRKDIIVVNNINRIWEEK
ncbi:hypothetical protein [Bacillus wiedmannii]|uniref:Uncharacterized protein n=1 Tax=Bacillus wiedmannii TaxID=1890302 RepID=A0A2A8BSQ6_9BACI|nr:hypothetical protein [Bacillus wiedmannii]PEM57608.1 hypothetical protein CN611_07285 [Bacillus wiedmannii]